MTMGPAAKTKDRFLETEKTGARPTALAIAALILACGGCSKTEAPSMTEAPRDPAPAATDISHASEANKPSPPPAAKPLAPVRATALQPAQPTPPTTTPPGADPQSKSLVAALARTEQSAGPMTPDEINAWKANLQNLVQQGTSSVPAIAEFLEKNQDTEFGPGGKTALGYSSARRAMFDALAQIGGPEATGTLTRVLKDSADPREIAALADRLASLSPEEHKPEIIQASREVLGLAASGKLPADTDVGPIFEVLQKYGDQTVLEDLEKGSQQWKYYSAIALGSLPDGAGVPSLIKMASEDTGGKIPALQILGQLAYDHPDARTALLQQARENKIPANYWPYMIDSLAGREFGYLNSDGGQTRASNLASDLKSTSIKFGNQNYFTIPNPASSTPEFIDQRTALINELKAVTSDPAALSALEQAQTDLNSRLPKTAGGK